MSFSGGPLGRWQRLWGALALVHVALWGAPQLALAHGPVGFWGPGFGYGYGYSYGYGYETWGLEPMAVMIPQGPPLLVIDQQYYEVGVPGLKRLCASNPELCAAPGITDSLHHLEGRRIAGITLAWTGLGAAILGPVISTAANCTHPDTYCRPDNGVVLGTVLGGLATTITGLVLLPGNHDVMRVVNAINRAHPDHPVGLKMSMLDSKAPALVVAGHF